MISEGLLYGAIIGVSVLMISCVVLAYLKVTK